MREHVATAALLATLTMAGCAGMGPTETGSPASVTADGTVTQTPSGPSTPIENTSGDDELQSDTVTEKLRYRLRLEPAGGDQPKVGVRLVNRTAGNTTVLDENYTLSSSRDLSSHIDNESTYRVTITVEGTSSRHYIHDYNGLALHIDDSGVVFVESVVL